MPPKQQLKKKCAKKDCSGIGCPFTHPNAPVFLSAPKEKMKKSSGALPFRPKDTLQLHREFNALDALTHLDQDPKNPDCEPKAHRTPNTNIISECLRCSRPFEMDIKEQEWFFAKNFSLPKRCKECRLMRKLDGVGVVYC